MKIHKSQCQNVNIKNLKARCAEGNVMIHVEMILKGTSIFYTFFPIRIIRQ
jgi:hypothetical protein